MDTISSVSAEVAPNVNLVRKRIWLIYKMLYFLLSSISLSKQTKDIDGNALWLYRLVISICMGLEMLYRVFYKGNQTYLFNGRRRGPHLTIPILDLSIQCIYGLMSIWGVVFVIGYFNEYRGFFMDLNKYFTIYEVVTYGSYILIALSCSPCLICVIRNRQHSSSGDVDIVNTLNTSMNVMGQEKKYKHVRVVDFGTNFVSEEETIDCRICFVNHSNTKIIPCEHNTYCSACINHVDKCPTCRGPINSIRVFDKVSIRKEA